MSKEKIEKSSKEKIIHLSIIVGVIVVILAVAGFIILKYQVEGEKNLPFHLTKMIVVSTAQGYQKSEPTAKWDLEIDQNNDIYLGIEKNDQYKKSETIQKVTIENFHTEGSINNMSFYRPAESVLYKKEEPYKIGNSIEYKGNKETNINNLEIANQGGVLLFRAANQKVATYQSADDQEIIHDGRLLQRVGVATDSIKGKLSFDLIIETGSSIKYKATITTDIPVGDIAGEGTCTLEKVDFSDVVFKRI